MPTNPRPSTYSKFWAIINTKGAMPKGLKNGLHLVEAAEAGASVFVRSPGRRAKSIPKWRWDQFAKTPWTPELSFGAALQLLHKKGTD